MLQPRPRAGAGAGTSSQIALEVVVNLYAAIAVLFVARAVLLISDVDDRVWIGRTVYRFTDPLVVPFGLFPGADRIFVGKFGLADFTILAIVVLIPLSLSLRRGKAESQLQDEE